MKKWWWLSLVVSTCIVGSIGSFGYAQEFPEDELVEERLVIPPSPLKPKIRPIYKHVETYKVPVITHQERTREYRYTYLPHPVTEVTLKRTIEEKAYKALPQVGVKSSSTTHRKSSYRRKRR